ncbi:MAG: DUF4397 domain-containing protein [Gemmatimonadaceae bacterium]
MRRILKLSLTCLAAGVVTACDIETEILTEAIPTAGVRFIHAVPDTALMDFRFVDMVENNPHFNIAFRNNVVTSPAGVDGVPASTLVQYKPARAGSRQFRIFMNGNCTVNACDQSYASTVVFDQTVTLTAGSNYTAIVWGNARGGAPAMRLDFFEETVADPGTNVALRVFNATGSAIDVAVLTDAGAALATPVNFTAVPALSTSAYATTAPAILRYNVQPAGGGTALFANSRALMGAAAVTVAPGPIDAAPGTTVAGSAVSGIVFPRSVSGSQAPNFTTPAISFVWDRRPPRPAGL